MDVKSNHMKHAHFRTILKVGLLVFLFIPILLKLRIENLPLGYLRRTDNSIGPTLIQAPTTIYLYP